MLGGGDGRAMPRGRPGRGAVRDPRAQQGDLRGGGRRGGDPGGRGLRRSAAALPHHPTQGRPRRRKRAGHRRGGARLRPRRGRGIRRPYEAARHNQRQCRPPRLGLRRRRRRPGVPAPRPGHESRDEALREPHLQLRVGRLGPSLPVQERRLPGHGRKELPGTGSAQRRRLRRHLRHNSGRGRRSSGTHVRLPLLRGRRAAGDLRAPALHSRVGRDRAWGRRPAGRHGLPGRVHVGRMVPEAVRAGDAGVHLGAGRTQTDRHAG